MLRVKDGRGTHKRELKKVNRKKILSFFENNPDSSKTDCCKELGLTLHTICRHLKEIQEEVE